MDSDDEWEEEEQLVLVQLTGIVDQEYLLKCDKDQCRILDVDKASPVLQIDKYLFTGNYKENESEELKYKCFTSKILQMTRSFIKSKNTVPSEAQQGTQEQPISVSDPSEEQGTQEQSTDNTDTSIQQGTQTLTMDDTNALKQPGAQVQSIEVSDVSGNANN